MAAKPTPGGSDGTYGTELNEFLDVSLASDGKVKDGAVFSTSAAPSVDAGVANKKYVDDQIPIAAAAVKAWGKFSSDGSLNGAGYNIDSSTKDSTGVYTINYTTVFADANYAVTATLFSGAARGFVTATPASSFSTVRTWNSSGTISDMPFMIIAIGTQ